MSDPRDWNEGEWEQFYDNYQVENDADAAAVTIQEAMDIANDGNFNETVGDAPQVPSA